MKTQFAITIWLYLVFGHIISPPCTAEMIELLKEVPLKTPPDSFDPNHPTINSDPNKNREIEWLNAAPEQRNIIRSQFRNYYTGRNSLTLKYIMYHRIPRPGQFKTRDECNPYLVGIDFCGENGNCFDLNPNGTAGAMFVCECHTGWKGLFCNEDIDECELGLCQNGAGCSNKSPGYYCKCQPHTYGFNCEKRYSHNPELFTCHSADNSSLIDWVPQKNFKTLLYFPQGLHGFNKKFKRFKDGDLGPGLILKDNEQSNENYGPKYPVYLKDSLLPSEEEASISYVNINHPYGLTLMYERLLRSYSGVSFQYVIQIDFLKPTLVRAFVTKGGMEGMCLFCKRLVTRYRITFRSGLSRWFKIKDDMNQEMEFDAKNIDEWVESHSEIISLDIESPRLRYPKSPFTAESLRIHILDWIPKKQFSNKNNDEQRNTALNIPSFYNPAFRFDVIGCHI